MNFRHKCRGTKNGPQHALRAVHNVLVPGTGIEPVLPQWKLDFTYHLQFSLPPKLLGVCGLDFIFTITLKGLRCSPSSLYTFLVFR
jgi:hypothetical protein